MSSTDAAGVIHDIGYQRYPGQRLGRRHIVGSLYGHGLRTAFGLGRGAKAKIFPWVTVGIIGVVAAVLTAIRSQSGEPVLRYEDFSDVMSFLVILFLASAAPELISRDLGTGVLPLYFSRPLRRTDYAAAKLAALVTATWLVLAVPQLLMYLGGVFSRTDGLLGAWREFVDLIPGLLYAGMYAVLLGGIAALVATATRRRAFAAGGVVAVFLVTTPIVGVLSVLGGESLRQVAPLASPVTLLGGVRQWLFDQPPLEIGGFGPLYGLVGVALAAGCAALFVLRYRRLDS